MLIHFRIYETQDTLLEKKVGAAPVYVCFWKKIHLKDKSSSKVYADFSTDCILCLWRPDLFLLEYLGLVREPEDTRSSQNS